MTYKSKNLYYTIFFLHTILCLFIFTTPFWISPRILYVNLIITITVFLLYIVNHGCVITHQEQYLSNYESNTVCDYIVSQIIGEKWIEKSKFEKYNDKYSSISVFIFIFIILFGFISLYLSCNYTKTAVL